ncbi:MAG: porin [Rhodoferax sp.]|nr:porin [Rhodoferax sp.]
MKKTLIAMAVLAASGASFAQVTITGSYAAGYQVDTNAYDSKAKAFTGDASGFGVDTSFIQFAASEDLGSGLKVAAKLSLDGFARTAAAGGDSNLVLSGGFGSLTLETGNGSDYLSGDYVGMDGKVFGAKTTSDSVTYKSPSFSGFTFALAHSEAGTTGAGLGVGAAGAYSGQRHNTLTASYASGPLSVTAGLRQYDQQGNKSLTRAKASYDLGVAKIGGGFVQLNQAKGTQTDTLLGVSVPLGSLTLVADVASRKLDDQATDAENGTRTGYGLSASYALSKRTSLSATYASWEAALNPADRTTRTALLLAHSF